MTDTIYSVHINDVHQMCTYACVDSAVITVMTILYVTMPIGT